MKNFWFFCIAASLLLAVAGTVHAGVRIGAIQAGWAGGLLGGGGFVNYATMGTDFNETMSGDLGLAIGQDVTGKNTNIGLLGRLEFLLGKAGDIKTLAGGNLIFATNPAYAAAAQSAFIINGFVGIEYMLAKNLGIVGTLTLLEIYSTSGTTQFGLGSGTVSGTGLGAAHLNFYSGIRLYL